LYLNGQSMIGSYMEPTPAPLGVMDASQKPMVLWTLRRWNPNYVGNCISVRNSVPTTVVCGFDGDGDVDVSALPALAAAGDGTLEVVAVYDQHLNTQTGYNLTSSARPKLVLNAIQNRAGKWLPGFDFTSKTINMYTSTTPFNMAGLNNVTVCIVASTLGWSSAGTHARAPAVSGVNGALMGYGTTAAALMYGAYGVNGETLYGAGAQEAITTIDSGIPDSTRVRNLWFNQRGLTVSGGADVRKLFTDREHGLAQADGVRGVVGNVGSWAQSHNGLVFEVAIFNNATPNTVADTSTALTDNEAWAISLGQRQYWGDLGAARYPDRYYSFASGQSLAQYYGTVASASTGLAADYASARVYAPDVQSLFNFSGDTTKELTSYFNTTAMGGSAAMMSESMIVAQPTPDNGGTAWLAYDGVTASKKFWWDQVRQIPGPCLVLWKANALIKGARYRKILMHWAQGEADAYSMTLVGEGVNTTQAIWKASTKAIFAQMRAWIGTNFPIVIQPLGRQTGHGPSMRTLRMVQNAIAAEVTNCAIGGETTHFTKADADPVHWGKGPADIEGFDRGAHQLARSFAAKYGVAVQWKGPYIASAVKGSNTIDLTMGWDTGATATDIQTVDLGTTAMEGFVVTDGTGVRTATAQRLSVGKIRITVSGGDLSGAVTLDYDTTQDSVDRLKMVVDNCTLPYGLQPVAGLVIS